MSFFGLFFLHAEKSKINTRKGIVIFINIRFCDLRKLLFLTALINYSFDVRPHKFVTKIKAMKYLIITLLSLFVRSGFSQNSVDLANVYFRTSPFNHQENKGGQKHMNILGFDAKFPLVINQNNVLVFGAEHQQLKIHSLDNEERSTSYFSNGLQMGIEHRWNKRSKTVLMGFSRLNSDFNSVDISHFQQGGLLLNTTARSEKFEWKYGAYYNTEFYGPLIVPLFGFNWTVNEVFMVKMVLPVSIDLSYKSDSNLVAGIRFEGVNASYRTNQNQSKTPSYLDRSDNNLWAYTEFEIGKNVWFHVKAGHSILRNYTLYTNDQQVRGKVGPINIGDSRKNDIHGFKDGLSLEARLIYRLPLE